MNTRKNLHTMLVCLDLTEIDPNLIEYASFLSQYMKMNKVIFLHVIQAYDLPDKSSKKFPDLKSDLSKRIESVINNSVSSHFKKNLETEVITKIENENAANMIINFTGERKVDLALIGQKYGEDRRGQYGQKIAAQIKSDLMFIPENPELSIARILCALDLSKVSERAFKRALEISKATDATLLCAYIYDTKKSYFPVTTFRTSKLFEKKIRKKYGKFLARFNLSPGDVELRLMVDDEIKSQGEKIYEEAEKQQADLLVVGAKGRTTEVTSLLGNITEKLRRMEKQIPIMIMKNVKKKK